MHTKKPIYMRYKQACGICSRRKSLYKRHQIIPSANNSFMYDGAEKYLQFESSMAAMPALYYFEQDLVLIHCPHSSAPPL